MVPLARLLAVGLVAGLLSTLPATAGTAPATAASGDTDVVARKVYFRVENTNTTAVECATDERSYRLRGRLVGPRGEVLSADVPRVNVLVHDLATGAFFWNLRRHPGYDYATRLAQRGETSLVLDRLGYDSSPVGNGNATCLGAQADMLHQVVQHLRAGRYDFQHGTRKAPGAQHVVVHGHSAGAAVAQLEAATFDDVDGLVLMSWTDSNQSRRAVDEASQQSSICLRGREYARFGQTRREFRKLFFSSAPGRVSRRAAELRNPTPCGDVLSLGQTLLAATKTTRDIEAPVLLLFGSRDRLNAEDAARQQAQAYSSSARVVTRTFAGAGNALPLERSAPDVRRRVTRWLCGTLGC